MGSFNVQYANSIDELKAKNPTESTVLDLVTADEYNFGTGPWFYSNQCQDAKALNKGKPDAWFSAYMSCVGVNEDEPGRKEYFASAKKAFGI